MINDSVFCSFNTPDKYYTEDSATLIDKWSYKYIPQYLKYSDDTQISKINPDVLLKEFAWEFYRKTLEKPGNWTERSIERVCCVILPSKWTITQEQFSSLPSLLITFLEWLTKQGIISNQEPIIAKVQSLSSTMILNYANRDCWHHTKTIRLAIFGYDTQDFSIRPPHKKALQGISAQIKHKEIKPVKNTTLKEATEDDLQSFPSADSVISELQSEHRKFPDAALSSAVYYKDQISPKLLDYLSYIYDNYELVSDSNSLHIYALFLLAQFREKLAYKKIITLLTLPPDVTEHLFGDLVTEPDFANILASVYTGNFDPVHQLIMNDNVCMYVRTIGFKLLLSLYKTEQISYEELVEKFTFYINTTLSKDAEVNQYLLSSLGNCILDAYIEPLFPKLQSMLIAGEIDYQMFDLMCIAETISDGEAKSHLNLSNDYYLIDDIKSTYGQWGCFNVEPKYIKPQKLSKLNSPPQPIKSKAEKIGRNDPCPCGSGKKFKKCCI